MNVYLNFFLQIYYVLVYSRVSEHKHEVDIFVFE